MCYNETECDECTQGFYLDENGECKRKYLWHVLEKVDIFLDKYGFDEGW